MGGILVKAKDKITHHTSGSTGGGPDVLRFLSGVYIPRSRRLRGGRNYRGAVYMPYGMDICAVFLVGFLSRAKGGGAESCCESMERALYHTLGWLNVERCSAMLYLHLHPRYRKTLHMPFHAAGSTVR